MKLEDIKEYFTNNEINLSNTKFDLELLRMFFDNPKKEIKDFVKEIFNSGTIQNSIFFEEKQKKFYILSKFDGEIGISILLEIVKNHECKILTIFPDSKNGGICNSTVWYPLDCEVGEERENSCVELEHVSFFNNKIMFDRELLKLSSSNEYFIYGFGIPEHSNFDEKYNDYTFEDRIEVIKLVDLKGKFEWIKSFNHNFLKCYANVNDDCRDLENDWELGPEINIPIYIPEYVVNSDPDFLKEKLVDTILMGNIKTV